MSIEPKDKPFPYVLAFNRQQYKDVTARYTNNFVASILQRLPAAGTAGLVWWNNLLKSISTQSQAHQLADTLENDEMRLREGSSSFPNSLSAFKSHPLFILEKDIPKYSAVEPNTKALGEFKEQKIYPRTSIKTLHVQDKWIQNGRMLMEGEQPVKVVKGKSTSSPTAMLYGEWQTEVYKPANVVNGIVPTNSFGNVFMFKPEMVPIGGVHLRVPGILRVARKLKISAGPALVGWEVTRRKPYPIIDGCVVAQENAQTLLEAWVEDQKHRNSVEETNKEKEIIARWKRFYKALLVKEYVENTYGHGRQINDSTSKFVEEEDAFASSPDTSPPPSPPPKPKSKSKAKAKAAAKPKTTTSRKRKDPISDDDDYDHNDDFK
eukprot:gene12195-14272_t